MPLLGWPKAELSQNEVQEPPSHLLPALSSSLWGSTVAATAVHGGGVPRATLGCWARLDSRPAKGLAACFAFCPDSWSSGCRSAWMNLEDSGWTSWVGGGDGGCSCWGQGNRRALPQWGSTLLGCFLVLRVRYTAVTLLCLLVLIDSWIWSHSKLRFIMSSVTQGTMLSKGSSQAYIPPPHPCLAMAPQNLF